MGRNGFVVKLLLKDDPRVGARVDLANYAKMKGIFPKPAHHTGFITPYASKDHEENFSEMIAYYCLGKLPEDQVGMLHSVL